MVETRAGTALCGRTNADDAEPNALAWLVDAFTSLAGESTEPQAPAVPPLLLAAPSSTSKLHASGRHTLAAVKLKARVARSEEQKRAVEERMGRELSPASSRVSSPQRRVSSPERKSPSPDRRSPSPERVLAHANPSLPSASAMPPPRLEETQQHKLHKASTNEVGAVCAPGARSKSPHSKTPYVESEWIQKARAQYARPAVDKPPSLLPSPALTNKAALLALRKGGAAAAPVTTRAVDLSLDLNWQEKRDRRLKQGASPAAAESGGSSGSSTQLWVEPGVEKPSAAGPVSKGAPSPNLYVPASSSMAAALVLVPSAQSTRARTAARTRAQRSQKRTAVAAQILAAGQLRRGAESNRRSAWGTGELVSGTYNAHLRVDAGEAVAETPPSRWLEPGSHYAGRRKKKEADESPASDDGWLERCPVCQARIDQVDGVLITPFCQQCGEYLVVREFVTV